MSPRGDHCGAVASCTTTSAYFPGSSEPISSPIPIASAPRIVAISNASCAPNHVGSTRESFAIPAASAAARRMSTWSPALVASQPTRCARRAGRSRRGARWADALPKPEVGPRAVRDRGRGAQQRVDLRVVEPDRVREQQVRAEHAELVEVHERAVTEALEIHLRVGRRRRDVHRHAGAAIRSWRAPPRPRGARRRRGCGRRA